MLVKDAMSSHVISVAPTAPVADALDLMIRAHVGGLPVIDAAGLLVGVLSESDLLSRWEIGAARQKPNWLSPFLFPGRAAQTDAGEYGQRVRDIMSADVASVTPYTSLEDALNLMQSRRVKRLPVVVRGEVVGMLARADLIVMLAMFTRPSPDQPDVSDMDIKRRVEADMQAVSWTPTTAIDVEVVNGVVGLRGVLTEERERGRLHSLLENIAGVRAIRDQLSWAEQPSSLPSHFDASDGKPF